MLRIAGARWSAGALVVLLAGGGARVHVQGPPQTHPGEYSQADIVSGSTLYREQCTTCHGAQGNAVGGVDLRRGRFRRAASDDELKGIIANGIPGTGIPPFKFAEAELTAVVAFLRAGLNAGGRAVRVGDAARGRDVFEGKGQCATCHRVNGVGPVGIAPELSDAGASRTALSLQMSILDPSSVMMPINRPVRLVTSDGATIRGRRLNEDTYSIQLVDDQGQLRSVLKADLREYEIVTRSPMPSYQDKLTGDEVADVVAYLLSLRG